MYAPDQLDLSRVEVLLPEQEPLLNAVGGRFPGLLRELESFWGGYLPEIHAVAVVPPELLEGVADFRTVVGLLAVTEEREDGKSSLTLFSFYTRNQEPEIPAADWEWWAFPLSSDRMEPSRRREYEEELLRDFPRRVLYAIHTRENRL